MESNRTEVNGTESEVRRSMTQKTHHDRPFPYTRSRSNQQLQQLRDEGPLPTSEIDGGARFSTAARKFVGALDPPWAGCESIWYLWGDERRAVRLFVDTYEDQVRESLSQSNSTLASRMDDALWRILCEEWLWSGNMTDDEIEKYRQREEDDEEDEDDE